MAARKRQKAIPPLFTMMAASTKSRRWVRPRAQRAARVYRKHGHLAAKAANNAMKIRSLGSVSGMRGNTRQLVLPD